MYYRGKKFIFSYYYENGHPVACNVAVKNEDGVLIATGTAIRNGKHSLERSVARREALISVLQKLNFSRSDRVKIFSKYYTFCK